MILRNDRPVKMTQRRVTALRQVRNGKVEYVERTADWMVEGQATDGWDWRTFSDLRKFKLVTTGKDGNAVLTTKGESALDTLPEKRRRTTP